MDIHESNRQRFNLPERRIAKIFVFRLIYGGQAYSYAHDSDFNHVSKSVDYWQEVIDRFYDKYRGIKGWHESLVSTVLDTGQLVMPTGRVFTWSRSDVAKRPWFHTPKILNYPVQGTGADLVAIGRVAMWKRLRREKIEALFQSTVHDSIDIDVKEEYNIRVGEIMVESIQDIPKNFKRLFNKELPLPLNCEIIRGNRLSEAK